MRDLTRRTIMGGALALPAIATAPALAASTSAWDRAHDAYTRARAAWDAHSIRQDEAEARAQEAAGPPPALIWQGRDGSYPIDVLTLRERLWTPGSQGAQLLATFEAWSERRDAAKEAEGLDQFEAEGNRLLDALCDAERALMATPAPHAEAVARKLAFLHEDAMGDDVAQTGIAAVAADVRRLMGAA